MLNVSLVNLCAQVLDKAHCVFCAENSNSGKADTAAQKVIKQSVNQGLKAEHIVEEVVEAACLLNLRNEAVHIIDCKLHYHFLCAVADKVDAEGIVRKRLLKGLAVPGERLELVKIVALYIRLDNTVLRVVKLNGSDKVGEVYKRGGCYIVDNISVVGNKLGNIVDMHMAREGVLHTCIGKKLCNVLAVLNKESGKGCVLLVAEVGNEIPMGHTDYAVTVFRRLFNRFKSPFKRSVGKLTCGFVLVNAVGRSICRIDTAVHYDKTVAVFKLGNVGKHTCFFARGRCEFFNGKVEAEVFVKLTELLGCCDFGTFLCHNAVSEHLCVGVVDIVVAVCDKHGNTRLLFPAFEYARKLSVACKVAVLCKVAGNKQIVKLAVFRLDLVKVKCGEQNIVCKVASRNCLFAHLTENGHIVNVFG